MNRDYKLFIKDILESIKLIENYTQGISEYEFKANPQLQDSVIRRLEIIGEATKKIPRSVKEANKHIDWQGFSMYRDFIIHSYFEASVDRIWNIVKSRIPKLRKDFEEIKLL